MHPRTIAALLLLATVVWAGPSLTVAYRCDVSAAPLYDACLYSEDFRLRYGLYLKPVAERDAYSLVDGGKHMLSLRLAPFDSDSAVLSALWSGSAQVGILQSEQVLAAVLEEQPVKIIAPLQRGGDMLVANRSIPAADWNEFLAWVKAQTRQVTIAHIGSHSMTMLGFCQALEHEHVPYDETLSEPETAMVKLVRFEDWPILAVRLELGQVDAAILREPIATLVSAVGDNHTLGRIDILPPGRFEDRPGVIIAATGSAIRNQGDDIGRFLELMAVATHYANNHTRNTLAAACRWLDMSPALESIPLRRMGFSSLPDVSFTDGIWNWFFALRLRNAVPQQMAGYMEKKDWLGVPYDSLLLMPALDRAGARIIR